MRLYFGIVWRYFRRQPSPQLDGALRLIFSYNLAVNLSRPSDLFNDDCTLDDFINLLNTTIEDRFSVNINHHLRPEMSAEWRKLHQELLNDISNLIHQACHNDELKNGPLTFLLTNLLFIIWENIQHDAFRSRVRHFALQIRPFATLF